MLHGCDISHYQGKNFDMSKEDFVIAKATEGKTFVDNCFSYNMEKALSLNKLIGAYHFARPDNNLPAEEARHFYSIVKPYIGKCLLALDWEGNAWDYSMDWALAWLKEVESLTGVKPLIYCHYKKISLCTEIAKNGNGVWCARWANDAPSVKPPFSVMALWQYTSKPYDKDKFLGDKDAWMKYCATKIAVDEGSGDNACGCTFCKDFETWINEHGYVKE